MHVTVHRETDNQLVQLRMRYTAVREWQELHDQPGKDLPSAAPVVQTKQHKGSNISSEVSPFLHKSADA